MRDNQKKVNEAVAEVGYKKTDDPEKMIAGLDYVIEMASKMKEKVKNGQSGELGMKVEQFRDVQPQYAPGTTGEISEFVQVGPTVFRVVILDWKKEKEDETD